MRLGEDKHKPCANSKCKNPNDPMRVKGFCYRCYQNQIAKKKVSYPQHIIDVPMI